MAQNENLWHELEDKLKSLTSSLQSLPSEMREMALSFITKQMESKDGSRSATDDKAASEQQSNETDHPSSPDNAANRLPKKRSRSTVNGVGTPTDVVPCTSNVLMSKKPGRQRGSSPQLVRKEMSLVDNCQSLKVPKKRGRPSNASKSEKTTEFQATAKGRRPSCHRDIYKDNAAIERDDVAETLVQATRSSQRVRRRPKSFADDDDDGSSRDDRNPNTYAGNVIGSKTLSVILVPVDERHLSAAMSADIDTESIDESTHSLDQGESNDVDYGDYSQTEKTVAKRSRLSAVNVKSEPVQETSDAEQADFYGSPKRKKRGRPSKKDLQARILVKAKSGYNSNINEKRPIGRPRFSTYVSGYVPKPKPYMCKDCGKNLASRASLKEHVRRHTGDLYMCHLCGQKFATKSGFLLHKKYHEDDPEVFKCTFCKYTVSSQKLLDEHFEARHDPNRPRQHTCYVCGKGFHQEIQLEKHLVSHAKNKPYVCDECDFSTAYPNGLAKHKYNVHERENRQLFECELCHVKLRSRGTYNEHLGRHFNQRNKKCELCQKSFPTASQLASHRRCHSDAKIPCELCGKMLRNKHKLKIHMFLHTGQKDFACPYCSYVSYVKHNLKKHCASRHNVEYPPVNKRMEKFQANDATSIAASLTDPVAIRCVKKIAVSGVPSSEGGLNLDETPGTVNESLNSLPEELNSQTLAPVSSASDTNISMSSTSTNVLPVSAVTLTAKTTQLEPILSGASCIGEIANNYTGGHSVVPNIVPIFSLPLFSTYNLSNNLVATPVSSVASVASANEKNFITLTPAIGDQQTYIIAPQFNTL